MGSVHTVMREVGRMVRLVERLFGGIVVLLRGGME